MQLLDQIDALDNFPAPLPQTLLAVKQTFDAPRVPDVAAAARAALEQGELLARIQPGASVAVGVGSRGIANIALITRAVIQRLREAGAEPFVFPAMGSHGGATAEGQREMLAGFGVTPEYIGAEVRATMEVVQVGQIEGGPPLFQDIYAAAADAVLLLGRVKPHTDFRSNIESGQAKMALIGMGKQHGAAIMHKLGVPGFQKYLAPAARIYERDTNLIGGLAILENAYDETAAIIGMPASEIGGPPEEELLKRAKSLMASLPFPEIDVLVVRQLGKNISGTGMDTNIIGRLMIPRQPENFGGPDIAVIALLDLTKETHGNATGMGLANVTTRRVVEQIDWIATYTNGLTSGVFGMQRSHMPTTMSNDRRAIEVAVRGCGEVQETARYVFIRDTLTLNHFWVSPSMRAAVEAHPRLELIDEVPLEFDARGNMTSPWDMEAPQERAVGAH